MTRLGFPAWCGHHGPCSRNQSPPYCTQGQPGCEWTAGTSPDLGRTDLSVPASWGPEQLQGRDPLSPAPHISLLGHSHHLVLANDGGAPPPKLACSPSGPPPPHPFFLSHVPGLTLWPRPCPRGRSLPRGVTSPRLLMVVPCSLQSQSQERCQSPTIPPAPCPQGLVTFRPQTLSVLLEPGAASKAISLALPGMGIHAQLPLSGRPLLSVNKARGPGWASEGLSHVPPTLPTTILHTACSHSTCRPGGKDGK